MILIGLLNRLAYPPSPMRIILYHGDLEILSRLLVSSKEEWICGYRYVHGSEEEAERSCLTTLGSSLKSSLKIKTIVPTIPPALVAHRVTVVSFMKSSSLFVTPATHLHSHVRQGEWKFVI